MLTFKTVVADVPANTRTSGNLTNQGTLAWTDPVAGAQTRNSATLNTQIVEPLIAQAKVDDRNPARVQPGEIITYTVTTSNPSLPGRISPAYDVATSDLVPVGLTPIDAGGAPAQRRRRDPGCHRRRLERRPAHDHAHGARDRPRRDIVLHLPGEGRQPAGRWQHKMNTVTATATSLPGAVTGERTSGTGYAASQSDTVQIGAATIAKDVSPTSATIGDPVTYTLHVTIPAGIALFDTTVVDTVPDSIDVDGYGPVTCETGCGTVIPSTSTPRWSPGRHAGLGSRRHLRAVDRADDRADLHRSCPRHPSQRRRPWSPARRRPTRRRSRATAPTR